MTPDQLREKFLEMAAPLVDQYVNAAIGKEDIKSLNVGCRNEVWELLKQIILKSTDKINIEVQEPMDILKAVEAGKCTLEQGQQLLDMYVQLTGGNEDEGRGAPQLTIVMNNKGEGEVNVIENQQPQQRSIGRDRSSEMVEEEPRSETGT